MLAFIGLTIAWVLGLLIFSLVLNTIRAKNGAQINDGVTAFLQGAMFGPIGILASFSPQTQTINRGAMGIGGLIGTIIFINIYMDL